MLSGTDNINYDNKAYKKRIKPEDHYDTLLKICLLLADIFYKSTVVRKLPEADFINYDLTILFDF